MIAVQNLSKSFGSISAVKNLSFELKRGEILSLLGPNGAGKTTTLRMLAGYFPPTSGKIFVNGADLFRSAITTRKYIGYLPEHAPLYGDMVVRDFLNWVCEVKQVPKINKAKEIASVADQCAIGTCQNRLIGKLSKGFKQRVALAQALIGDPSVLVLDEPTVGLDPMQISEIRSLIKTLAKDRAVVLSTHILPEAAQVSTRVVIIHQGKLVAGGTPEELAQKFRHQSELVLTVRGRIDQFEKDFPKLEGILAVRLENSAGSQHEYRVLHKKDKDLRPLIARLAIDSGLELLNLADSPMSLEDVFLKIVDREESS